MSEEKEKICPMPLMRECIEKKCAWWDYFIGSCAILNISRHGAAGSLEVMKKESLAARQQGSEGKTKL